MPSLYLRKNPSFKEFRIDAMLAGVCAKMEQEEMDKVLANYQQPAGMMKRGVSKNPTIAARARAHMKRVGQR
jgi:uncharacterized protein YneF (UPF0154 family)